MLFFNGSWATLESPEFLIEALTRTCFVAADVVAGDRTLSRNMLYFSLPKDLALPAVKLAGEVREQGGSYKVKLTSKVLARSVFLSAGDFDATYSDNFFDMAPGETREIEVKTQAPLEQFRSVLKVVSLIDSFTP